MRVCCAGLLLLTVAMPTQAASPALKEARQQWLRGNYEEARTQFEALLKEPQQRVAAVIGISQTWQSVGEYDKALGVLDGIRAELPKDADVLARRAELLFVRGRWTEAEAEAEQALNAKPEHFLARWIRARILFDRGDLKQADGEFRWFVRTYSKRDDADTPIKDPDELLLVGRAGLENARWHRLSDQFEFVLTEIIGDILKQDASYWHAELLAGLMLLEKYNRGEALAAFDKVLAINPRAAEALVGKGVAALQKLELKAADQFAVDALKINPHLPDALRLAADVALASGDLPGAVKRLKQAQLVNPRDERTLGRLAACHLLQHHETAFQALRTEVVRHDSKPGIFYLELAERLEERRHFDIAERYLKQALEARPMLTQPQNSLGLLYMRLGREQEAREVLSKAFEADPFNVRVSNSLKVLRHLEKYETLKTEHFAIRFDPQGDRVLARFLSLYLEELYVDLAKRFAYQPPGPILIEVFNNHDMFSGRVVAVPDLHTIGACTGRMVALVSPRGKGLAQPFNWARVIRHELVHIFNLEQTGFQVPHWLTEGLAVSNEGFPRPPSWDRILLKRVTADELLDLTTINLGFMRPRSPEEWNLAYCQSQLYVEYLTTTYGDRVVGELLNAYRDGLDTPTALRTVCKTDVAAIEQGYRSHLNTVVKTIKSGLAVMDTARSLPELEAAHEKTPDDMATAAKLADAYLEKNKNAQARRLAETVLAKQKDHPLALYVKSRLLIKAGDDEEARKLLEFAIAGAHPDSKILQAYGKLCFEAKEFKKAAELFERGRSAEPSEPSWLTELVRVYDQTGETSKQIDVLKALALTNADQLDVRKKVAKLLVAANRFAEAESYARQAMEIDVLDEDAQQLLTTALDKQDKRDQANRLRTLLQK